VYAGYEAASLKANADAFMAFANEATDPPSSPGGDRPVKQALVDAHAEAIHEFLFVDAATALPWDGFGFDIEIGALKSPYAPLMRALIRRIAELIAPKPMAYATYGFTGPKKGPNGMDVTGTLDFFNSQPFDIAVGMDNIIARPMMYEAPMGTLATARQYVKDVIAYALDVVKLKPEQLQMGQEVQLQPVPPPEPGQPKKQQKIPPGLLTVSTLEKIIELEQAPREVGLILFGLFFPQRKQRMREFVEYDEIYRKHLP
jgi:hypothetical protein